MTKEQGYLLATNIVSEIKKNYSNAKKNKSDNPNKIKNILYDIKIVETENSWQVHIPYAIYSYTYGVKNIVFDSNSKFTNRVEITINNAIKAFLISQVTEGTVNVL